jgi:hypothetical protein
MQKNRRIWSPWCQEKAGRGSCRKLKKLIKLMPDLMPVKPASDSMHVRNGV